MSSTKAIIAKRAIITDLMKEEWMKKSKEYAQVFCKTCNQYYPYRNLSDQLNIGCSFCKEKEDAEKKRREELSKRAEMIHKAIPVQSTLSFADMAKRK